MVSPKVRLWIVGSSPIFWGPKTPPFRATAIAGYLQITYLKQIKKEKGGV